MSVEDFSRNDVEDALVPDSLQLSPFHDDTIRSLDKFLEGAMTISFSSTSSSSSVPFTSSMEMWWKQRNYWWIFICLGVANSSDASEILCLSYILSDDHFSNDILHGSSWRAGLLAAAVFAGMLLGGLLMGGGWGDVWGRKPTLLTGLAMNSIAGLLSAVAWDVPSLASLRFVSGFGIGATIPPLFTLCSELAPPKERGFCVTIAASFWMVGSIYVAVLGWWWWHANQQSGWRFFAVLCALPSALGWILVAIHVPESPRFLLLQGRYTQAVDVAQDLANRLQSFERPWSEDEAREHLNSVGATYRIGHGGGRTTPGHGEINGIQAAWEEFLYSATLLYSPELRGTTAPMQLINFSLSFGSYGLYTWINTIFKQIHLRNVYFNALLFAFSNLPGNLLAAYFMDRMERTRLLSASITASAVALFVFAGAALREDPSSMWIIASSCTFQVFSIISWNAIDVLSAELFPTTVRATGMGVCSASGRVGAMLAQFVNGALVPHPVVVLVVAASTLLVGAMAPFLLPHDFTQQAVADTLIIATTTSTTTPLTGRRSEMNNTITTTMPSPNVSELDVHQRRRHPLRDLLPLYQTVNQDD